MVWQSRRLGTKSPRSSCAGSSPVASANHMFDMLQLVVTLTTSLQKHSDRVRNKNNLDPIRPHDKLKSHLQKSLASYSEGRPRRPRSDRRALN
jgi:hypothetical protein